MGKVFTKNKERAKPCKTQGADIHSEGAVLLQGVISVTYNQGQTESADFFGDFCTEFFEKSVEFCGMVLEYRRVQKLKTLQITLKLFTS